MVRLLFFYFKILFFNCPYFILICNSCFYSFVDYWWCVLLSICFLSVLAQLFLSPQFVVFPCPLVFLLCISFPLFLVSFSSAILSLSYIISFACNSVLLLLVLVIYFGGCLVLCLSSLFWLPSATFCFVFGLFALVQLSWYYQFENQILPFLVFPLSDVLFPHLLSFCPTVVQITWTWKWNQNIWQKVTLN